MKRVSLLGLASCVTLFCVVVSGCASNVPDSPDQTGSTTSNLDGTITIPDPGGAYFATITARGTGCPPGTWDANISDDGLAFTVRFNAYEAILPAGHLPPFAAKDCTLSMDLHTPAGYSFSVSDFSYQGYAILDKPGMVATQTAKYYFQGNSLTAQENRSDMRGPYNDSYTVGDTIGIADQVWSPCGATRTLQALTRLVITNNPQNSGNGYLNQATADGMIHTPFTFKLGLNWRSCSAAGVPDTRNPCRNVPATADGRYCGNTNQFGFDNVAADPKHLYTCRNGNVAANTACARGCTIAPPGRPDYCTP